MVSEMYVVVKHTLLLRVQHTEPTNRCHLLPKNISIHDVFLNVLIDAVPKSQEALRFSITKTSLMILLEEIG
jgi:hypothetical protein